MKLNKLTILILSLFIVTSVANASEYASISATATVVPVLGVMSQNMMRHTEVSANHRSMLSIQAPKKSALIIHLENKDGVISNLHLRETLTHERSVSDLYSLELSENEATQIVTIIPIDN